MDAGRFYIAKAREVCPHRTYEVIEPTKPLLEVPRILTGIGLGESMKQEKNLHSVIHSQVHGKSSFV